MSQIEPLSATLADLSFDGRADGQRLVVRISGEAAMHSVEALSDYLKTLHREALQRRVAAVVVDIQELRFLNSACFKVLISWIASVARGEPQYRITFVGNHEIAWQKRSLVALRCVDERIVSLEGVDTEPELG